MTEETQAHLNLLRRSAVLNSAWAVVFDFSKHPTVTGSTEVVNGFSTREEARRSARYGARIGTPGRVVRL